MRTNAQRGRFLRRGLLAGFLLGGFWALACSAAAGAEDQPPADRAGWVFRINLPITGRTSDRVTRFARNAVERAAEARVEPVLIFELVVPPDQDEFATTSKFGVSSDLADFLYNRGFITKKAQEVVGQATTVAYLPQSVQGHAVLVALACDQIVMSPDAEIGPADADEQTITPRIHNTYEEIAKRRKIPPAIALGLVDRRKEVLQVETDVSREYVLAEDLEELKKRRAVQPNPKVLFEAGQPGRLTGRQARDLDVVNILAADRGQLGRLLDLPPNALEEDPSLSEEWQAIRVDLKGPMSGPAVTRAQASIRSAGLNVNFICLWIDSAGGSLGDSIRLANFLADQDPGRVRTVAYVPEEALADASLVALACDHVVMHPEAVLGGEGDIVFSNRDLELARDTIRKVIAKRKSRSWSLPTAMIDPNLEVFRYTRLGKVKYSEYFSEEEWREQADSDQWKQGEPVTERPFQVSGREAVDYWLAHEVVEDFAELKELYGLEADPALSEPGWAQFLIDAMAHPAVAFFLLVVGFSAIYAELHAPGIGIGGFLALVCFLLFFWSRFLGGTAGWLEVTLFVAGVLCLLLEVFVLPGFGIFGLGGGLLILVSLILASQTFFLPQNTYQAAELRRTLTMLGASAVAVIAAVVLLNRWLPRARFLGGMVLHPPSDEEVEDLSQRESLVHFESLLGAQGITTTQLTPSGKARFGSQLVDVMADSEVIPQGTEIVVVEVLGNRVLVRPASEGDVSSSG